MLGAAVAIARDHGVAGFFRGWLPFYLRAPRPKERLDMAVFEASMGNQNHHVGGPLNDTSRTNCPSSQSFNDLRIRRLRYFSKLTNYEHVK